MTEREALKLALEALKQIDEAMPFPVAKLAQAAIKEALAQPEQEPVAWRYRWSVEGGNWVWNYATYIERQKDDRCEPLYTTPPQRTWVGLTDEEVKKIVGADRYTDLLLEVVNFVEAKLKEKNT
jgi:hypothetical protein